MHGNTLLHKYSTLQYIQTLFFATKARTCRLQKYMNQMKARANFALHDYQQNSNQKNSDY